MKNWIFTFAFLSTVYGNDVAGEKGERGVGEEIALLDIGFTSTPAMLEVELPAPAIAKPTKSTFLAVSMGLVPGLGHMYLGDMATASILFGSFGGSLWGSTVRKLGYDVQDLSFETASNAWFYGIYAAYRDARIFNDQAGYSYQMPRDSFRDLVTAPFDWKVISSRDFWGGMLLDVGLISCLGFILMPSEKVFIPPNKSVSPFYPLNAFPVGIGEEALFRGFIQPQLIEAFGPVAGIATSSLLFGAAHVGNGLMEEGERRRRYFTYIIPYISLSSAYYGYVAYKNNSLREVVALHSWYDFIIMSLSAFLSKSVLPGPSHVKVSFSF
jgi:membrane protease YdiL (CAAX protease family)